jgi:hypothetical protein
MTKKLIILFVALAGLVLATSASYTVTLFQPSVFGGTELKPGDYKLTVQDNKAVMQKGKEKIEANVKSETSESKYSSTSVRYTTTDGKNKVQEIRLGGTTTKLVFN